MLEKLQEKKRENKGFTLMEMLIVVAIIAVLVAIAIPTFMGQLERAREATDVANIRSAMSEAIVANFDKAGDYSATVKLQSDTTDWKSDPNIEIAGIKASELIGSGTKKTEVKVTIDSAGNVKIDGKEAKTSQLDATTSASGSESSEG